ncbi:FlgD immunoglobulin-like domain containing protein [candidate division KSB1 bacterium]
MGGGLSLGFFQNNRQTGSFTNAFYSPWEDALDNWTHLCCTMKTNSLRLYINGIECVTANGLESTPSGLFYIEFGGFYGKLRQSRLWSKALTAEQIELNAGIEIAGSKDGLIACWQMCEGFGQTAGDMGPNDIQLVLGSSTAIESIDPVWLATDEPVGVDEEPKTKIPEDFALKQNYPNPFNPETIIQYELPKVADVTLKIYNIFGQEVKTLINETKPAGYHQAIWDGTNNSGVKISSGIYFYRIQAGEYTAARKMILLK